MLDFSHQFYLTDSAAKNYLNKMCLQGSGKGRIELAGTKHVFGYESLIDRAHQRFELALDFPVIGQRRLSLSLNPEQMKKSVMHSDFTELLKEKIPDRPDRQEIVAAVGQFLVYTSEFLQNRSLDQWPSGFESKISDDHFVMSRKSDKYLFMVDNFGDSSPFYKRSQFKLYLRSNSESEAIVTLFLVPEICDR